MNNGEGKMQNVKAGRARASTLMADRCPRCGGTGELHGRHGIWDCPLCDGTGIKGKVIEHTVAGGVK